MLSIQNALVGIKSTAEKVLGVNKKNELVTLTRDKVEVLVNEILDCNSEKEVQKNEDLFYENEAQLRQDILKRFKKILPGRNIPKDANWFEIQALFENFFTRNGLSTRNDFEKEYQDLAEKMEYPIELLRKVMYCVGRSHTLRLKTSGVV